MKKKRRNRDLQLTNYSIVYIISPRRMIITSPRYVLKELTQTVIKVQRT